MIFPGKLKMQSKTFCSYSSLKVLEMRLLGTFELVLLNFCHGNGDRYENFNFEYWCVYASSGSSFITIRSQEEKSSQIKSFKFKVPNILISMVHLSL